MGEDNNSVLLNKKAIISLFILFFATLKTFVLSFNLRILQRLIPSNICGSISVRIISKTAPGDQWRHLKKRYAQLLMIS